MRRFVMGVVLGLAGCVGEPGPGNIEAYACGAVSQLEGLPCANAGPDQTVEQVTMVTLDGTASVDPVGEGFTFSWTQTGGVLVALSDADTATASFVAPQVVSAVSFTFMLTVIDGAGSSHVGNVRITVVPLE